MLSWEVLPCKTLLLSHRYSLNSSLRTQEHIIWGPNGAQAAERSLRPLQLVLE